MTTNRPPQTASAQDEPVTPAVAAGTGEARRPPAPASGKPTERTFVVQLAPGCAPPDDGLRGRVQHLATSDGGNFASVEDLVAIMRRVLARAHDD